MEPLNENALCWASIELGRRFFLQLLLLIFPLNTVNKCKSAFNFMYPFVILQVYLIILLIVVLSTICFWLPYQRLLSNSVEIIVLVNLIVLLLLDATPIIRELLFVFTKRSSVSYISWLLGSIYYFPLVLLFVVLIGDLVYTFERYVYVTS